MKRILLLLFAIVFLLCGCLETPKATVPSSEPPTETIPPEPETTAPDLEGDLGIQEPDGALEEAGIRKYPLPRADHYAVRVMGDGLLLFSGTEDTTLTLLRDDTEPVCVTITDIFLSGDDASVAVGAKGVVYYDDIYNEMVKLDDRLQEESRLPMPADMGSEPVFSSDLARAFYFDRKGILRVLDVESGISRRLTDEKSGQPRIIGSHFGDTVLECKTSVDGKDEYLMIDAENGALLFRSFDTMELTTSGEWYFVPWMERLTTDFIFGEREGERSCFAPEEMGTYVPLPAHRSVASLMTVEEGCQIAIYSLSEPSVSRVMIPECAPVDVVMDDRLDWLWLLDEGRDGAQVLYSWDPSVSVQEVESSYITPYYTAEAPDTEGLDRIVQEAKALGDRFGLRIQIHQAAIENQPSDYSFTPEHLVPVYDHYLKLLETQLEIYPESMLKKLSKSSSNGRLTICLVRSISGTGDMGALAVTGGVQYWKGGNAYLAMAMEDGCEQTFHHELFHAIDTYVLAETKAYDFWDSLNPKGFSYDRDYVKNTFRNPEQYLTGDDRAFVDTYSMSFPKEDRARIMEFAVQEGQEEVFASEAMQKKLRTLCRGIRSAFGLGGSSEVFRWERYLQTPLA